MDDRPDPRGLTSEDVVKLQRWVNYKWSQNADSHPWYIDSLGWGEERARRIARLNEHRVSLGMPGLENDEVARPELARMRRLWLDDEDSKLSLKDEESHLDFD